MTTPHMMAEWRAGGIYGDPSCAADRAWMQFLDVLTGLAPSTQCPTLDELSMESEMPEIVRCGCCEQYHLRAWFGDCRDDPHRLFFEDVIRLFGEEALADADAEYEDEFTDRPRGE